MLQSLQENLDDGNGLCGLLMRHMYGVRVRELSHRYRFQAKAIGSATIRPSRTTVLWSRNSLRPRSRMGLMTTIRLMAQGRDG